MNYKDDLMKKTKKELIDMLQNKTAEKEAEKTYEYDKEALEEVLNRDLSSVYRLNVTARQELEALTEYNREKPEYFDESFVVSSENDRAKIFDEIKRLDANVNNFGVVKLYDDYLAMFSLEKLEELHKVLFIKNELMKGLSNR